MVAVDAPARGQVAETLATTHESRWAWMSGERGRKHVVFFAASQWGWLFAAMARHFKQQEGASTALFCITRQDQAFYAKHWPGAFDEIISTRRFYDTLCEPVADAQAVLETARQNEARYSILMMDLIQNDRHLGRGFMVGGPYHPRSRMSQQADYLRGLRLANEALAYFEQFFHRASPDVILSKGVGDVVGKAWAVVARAHGIPVRFLTASRVEDWYYWAENEFQETSRLPKAFAAVEPDGVFEGRWRLHADTTMLHERMKRNRTLSASVRGMLLFSLRHAYGRLRGYDKAQGYFWKDTLYYQYRIWADFKQLSRLTRHRPEEPGALPYVFFPLHIEPEMALATLSPEFHHQTAVIVQVAKNLPAGVRLVVKEHLTAVGRRPIGFYRQLAEIPNVVLVPPEVKATAVIERALGVVVLTGTAGLEAAVMGTPVVTFSLHNLYNILPHVTIIRDWTVLRQVLAEVCRPSTAEEARRRKEDGKRFLEALKRISFDVSNLDIYRKDHLQAAPGEAERFLETLQASLEVDGGSREAVTATLRRWAGGE